MIAIFRCRHSHFIMSSNLLPQNKIPESSIISRVSSQTEENLSIILDLLKDLHLSGHTPLDCR